jgi:hypothetical protein
MGNYPENVTRDKPSNKQVIIDLFSGKKKEEDLTSPQITYLRKVRSAYAMLLEAKSSNFILGSLMQTFDISQAQAYRIVRDTEKIFGSQKRTNKEIKRHIAEEMAKQTYRLALQKEDLKGMAAANRAYIEATGIALEDPDLPDFEKLSPSLILAILPNEDIELLRQLLSQGAVNLNSRPKVETIDITHEELETGPGGADQEQDR